MNLGELFIELGVVGDVKPLKEALKTLKASVKETNKQAQANIGVAKGIGLIITGVIAGVAAIDRMTNSLVKNNQSWVNFTRQTDLSLKSLQKYSGVAGLLDKSLGMEGAAGSIEQLNKRLFELRLTGEGARGFQLADVNPMGQDAFGVIEQLRSRFQGMDNTSATYLMEQMGLDPKLLPLIRLTREEFEDLYSSVKDYQLTAQQREEIQKMNIQLEIAATKFRYLKDRAILAIMPAFTKFMTSLARVTEMIARFIVKYKEILGVSAILLSRLKPVQALFSKISTTLASLISQIPIVGRLLVGLGSIFSRFLLPITAIYLLLDDIAGYFQGKNSGIGYIINFFDDYIAELKEKFGDLSFDKIIPKVTIDVSKVIIKAGKITLDKAQRVIDEQFANGKALPPQIMSLEAISLLLRATYQNIKEIAEKNGVTTGGAASMGYAGTLPNLSSSFITPAMQRNVSSNSITNNYDNRQITQSNSIMTNQTVDTLYNELVFARNSMNAGFA